ncbi:MAG: 16S rRNA (cytosine(1402)-N(4))-methyltransferase RsmH [Planctomycetes bacterium]|nr:16S rRNA (cytosine(1402)-N(4))-methyltransferase RsmH [Planctomycetota bacterium]
MVVPASGRHVQQAYLARRGFLARSKSLLSVVPETQHEHEPVLVAPVLRLLDPRPGQVILDGTVGLGGHAAALLPMILPNGRYIGIDLDQAMLDAAHERLASVGGVAVHLEQSSYAVFPDVLAAQGLGQVNHMLLDLGVNSAQLAEPARGFSFERDGPLDMRYDRRQPRQAQDLVNRLSESELADVLYEFGQEGMSRKVARRICQVRHEARITSTRALAQAVVSAYGAGGKPRAGRLHPATRVFQALRIAVNNELANLQEFLEQATDYLAPGGRLAVISFHSLEDGIVKRALRAARSAGTMEELTRRPILADAHERRRNPRSRSAKLRVAQRLD